MSFQDLNVKCEYRSFNDDMAKQFYIPLLKESVLYQRAVGFFSSSILADISMGIENLARNNGKIQLVASPRLQEKDIEAIKKGYENRNNKVVREAIRDALLRELADPESSAEEYRLNLLADLIAQNFLDIKIALTHSPNGIGMYHEKMGIMEDLEGNRVAFSGSLNESANALCNNYETIDVFRSWKNEMEEERVQIKKNAFERIWNNNERDMQVLEFPEVKETFIKKYKSSKPYEKKKEMSKHTVLERPIGQESSTSESIFIREPIPHIPDNVEMRDYQNQAYENWKKNSFRGIFDMATGTGKTYTALAAICRLYKELNGNLAVIIVCPFQHLVEQWSEDIKAFGMNPIICYSASKQRDWEKRLNHQVKAFRRNVSKHFCMLSTNATYSTERVQELLKELSGNTLLVVDEAHNFGSYKLQQCLLPNMKYRMALSATIERHGDEEGTEALFNYFGDKCIEYTLKNAIQNGMLTPYYYYPVVVTLNDVEREKYRELTTKIAKATIISNTQKKKVKLSEYAKQLLIKRARLVAAASNKISALENAIAPYKDKNHILVYCGSASMQDDDYEEGAPTKDETRQIDRVTDLLGNKLHMKVAQFTSREDAETRKELIKAFDEGEQIQSLIAIRCLDEGVNIPSIDKAFILASSTNPKEYIQRRGRVLRLSKGKKYAKIFDFITLPVSVDDIWGYSEETKKGLKGLAIRELIRMIDFADIAENPFELDTLVNEIRDAYDISDEDLKGESNYE